MKILEIETTVIKPKHRNVHPSKMNKNFKKKICKKNIVNQCPTHIYISKSKSRAKISLKMFYSEVNIGYFQWIYCVEWTFFLPTTIKSHVVKIVITWSISPDETIALEGSIDVSPHYQLAPSSIAPGCFTPNKF